MNVQQVVPLFGVMNIDASLRFYIDGLGFAIKKKWEPDGRIRWCWLELGGAAVMLQEFWKEGHHANVPKGPLGEGVSMNFQCKDALAIYRDLKAHGVDASRPFVGNSMWVTSVKDPDGYKLYFESQTNVPEETVFSD